MEWCIWWLQQHGGQQQRGQLFSVLVVVHVVTAVLVRAIGRGSEVAERPICDLVHVGRAVLASHDPSIVEWAVLATTAMVQDVSRLHPYVRDEMRTRICGSGSGVAAVTNAVDREAES